MFLLRSVHMRLQGTLRFGIGSNREAFLGSMDSGGILARLNYFWPLRKGVFRKKNIGIGQKTLPQQKKCGDV